MARAEAAAKRYAQAVFAMAREANAFDAWEADLEALRALLADPSVVAFLGSTTVLEERKFAVLDEALAGLGPNARRLAKLLVRKRRLDILDQIDEAFRALVNAERGLAVADVTTATPLSDDGRRAVVEAVRRLTGAAEVRLSEQVDRELLGGAVVRVGDHIIDGSVRTRLAGLRRDIAGSVS